MLSILDGDGLDEAAYRGRFGTDAFDDFAELHQLERDGLAVRAEGRLALTAEGVELSDAIGPALVSAPVAELMREYDLR